MERLRAQAQQLARNKAERDVEIGEALTKVHALEDKVDSQKEVIAEQADRIRGIEVGMGWNAILLDYGLAWAELEVISAWFTPPWALGAAFAKTAPMVSYGRNQCTILPTSGVLRQPYWAVMAYVCITCATGCTFNVLEGGSVRRSCNCSEHGSVHAF